MKKEMTDCLEEVIICEGKSRSEANKRIGGGFYNNPDCEICGGYNIKCGKYSPTPSWFGRD